MWARTENGEAVIPAAVERSGNNVIVRKNFQLVGASEEKPEHYEYDEWQMTADQYEVYKHLETMLTEQSGALVELAELISEVL